MCEAECIVTPSRKGARTKDRSSTEIYTKYTKLSLYSMDYFYDQIWHIFTEELRLLS